MSENFTILNASVLILLITHVMSQLAAFHQPFNLKPIHKIIISKHQQNTSHRTAIC